ncbi:MAG TPA: hypothetical protein PL033_13590 [Candidatus Brocadiia bacterium]|nr:hypothetical protein [Candidatus Brocadiia bacterium]
MSRRFTPHLTYGLRFHILPDADAHKRVSEVIAFCKRFRIEEVHLFVYPEEWNRGHVTEAELAEYCRMMRKEVARMKSAGLKVGCNPWSTTLHTGRGRRLRDGQNFETIVSPSGVKDPVCASMACPEWRRFIAREYAELARIGFDVLWLEDDWRYHNHDPLDWGGGFEDGFLRMFSDAVGRKVAREELRENILKPGEPHPWRGVWLDLWKRQNEASAAAIRDAVAKANPAARLGLMSSGAEVHSAEGRDWPGLFNAMAIQGETVHRPHYTSYGEVPGTCLARSAAMLDLQKTLRPEGLRSYPELENFPFGQFSKSFALTFAQMAVAQIYGSDGILLDLHPMTGNGVGEEPGIGEMLLQSRPGLELLGGLFPASMKSRGVGIPFNPQAALRMRTSAGRSMDELYPRVMPTADMLGRLGISFQMRRSEVANALWGNMPWAFRDAEIEDMLRGGLWLDAESASILSERGFAEHIGIRDPHWFERRDSQYSMEATASRKCGIRKGLRLGYNLFPRVLRMQPATAGEEWTTLMDCFGERLGAASVAFHNRLGGRVFTQAAPLSLCGGSYGLSFQRRAMARQAARFLAGSRAPVMADGGAHLLVMDMSDGAARRVAVMNMIPDPADATLIIPKGLKPAMWRLITPLAKPVSARPLSGKRACAAPWKLPYLATAVAELA